MFRKSRTYLDTAAGVSANPSSPHAEGRKAEKTLEEARTAIARLVEVLSDDVLFTSGATEANALAILGLLKAGDHALYLPSAHASIVENMKFVGARGVEISELPIKNASVDCGALRALLRPNTRLVAMDAVCGETGVVWNTREVAGLLQTQNREGIFLAPSGLAGTSQPVAAKNACPIVLHVDASQAPLTQKITRAHFGADMLTFDASKVGVVRGIGALIAHRTIPLTPLYGGGGQERGLRSGSEAVELAQEFAASLRDAALGREAFVSRTTGDRMRLVESIISTIPNVYINGGREQAPNILNVSLPGRDTDYLVALLDEAGFAVSTRSACETDSEEGSRAVFALTGDTERARATLRISWGARISARELDRFAEVLARSVAFIDNKVRR